jgi:Holliday junction resolvase RusA-like endonuclease
MSGPVTIRVYGTPAPQGSKRAFAIRKGGVPTGKVAVIESSHDRIKAWRQAVIDEAIQVKNWPALDGPLAVSICFFLKRPQNHYGTGRNAGTLKPTAPPYPCGTPDLGKLARSTEDALTAAGIWHDDALVVDEHIKKMYVGRLETTGARIEITPLTRTGQP